MRPRCGQARRWHSCCSSSCQNKLVINLLIFDKCTWNSDIKNIGLVIFCPLNKNKVDKQSTFECLKIKTGWKILVPKQPLGSWPFFKDSLNGCFKIISLIFQPKGKDLMLEMVVILFRVIKIFHDFCLMRVPIINIFCQPVFVLLGVRMKQARRDCTDERRDAISIFGQLCLQTLAEVRYCGVAKLLERRKWRAVWRRPAVRVVSYRTSAKMCEGSQCNK